MADKDDKEQFPVNLHDVNGGMVGTADHDEDLLNPALRDHLVESGGKTYAWNQRNARWTEVAGTIKLGRTEKVEPAPPAGAQPKP